MSSNVIIPNSFQTPNDVVDRIYQYLLPDEIVILSYTIRHIFGWREKIADRRGCISLTMYENGFTTKDGVHYGGCWLTRPRINTALKALIKYGIMKKIGRASQEDGQKWALTFDDPNVINWTELIARKESINAAASRRVQKAAQASAKKRKKIEAGGTTAVPPKTTELVRQPYQERYDSRTKRGTTAVHNQTNLNPPKLLDPLPLVEDQGGDPDLKPVQPHIAIIDAWYDGMPAAPIKRKYSRNALVATRILAASYTPEQVKAFVVDKYRDPWWAGKPLSLEHVEDGLPLWLKKRSKSSESSTDTALTADEMAALRREQMTMPDVLRKAMQS